MAKNIHDEISGIALDIGLDLLEELKEINRWSDKELVLYLNNTGKWQVLNDTELLFGVMHSEDENIAKKMFMGV